MEYRVRWEIDIDADSPQEAAERAREIQLDPVSLATTFLVWDFAWLDERFEREYIDMSSQQPTEVDVGSPVRG